MLKEPVSLWCNRTCTLVRCENPSGVPAGGSPIESKAKWRVGAFAGVNAPLCANRKHAIRKGKQRDELRTLRFLLSLFNNRLGSAQDPLGSEEVD